MLKTITQLVSPKNSENAKILQELHLSSARLEAARVLTEKADMLTQQATETVYHQFPDSLSLSKNSYLDEDSNLSSDINYLLKIIAYSLVANSLQLIDDYIINEIQNHPKGHQAYVKWYRVALEYIKNNHRLSKDAKMEADRYINYLIDQLN